MTVQDDLATVREALPNPSAITFGIAHDALAEWDGDSA